MLKAGILNPRINYLLSRTRHTNMIVIADRGFPFWPEIETVDLSLVDDMPTVIDVIRAIRGNFQVGTAFMAEEFRSANSKEAQMRFQNALCGVSIIFEPHLELKKRVNQSIGLIRTGDTTQFANVVLESA